MARLVQRKKRIDPDFLPNTLRMCAVADEHKALDIRAYDVQGLTVVADVLVVCSAASEPQMRAILDAVREGMSEVGVKILHSEGAARGGWCVLDYGDIIFHLFRKEAREFYDLDGLWADAPRIALDFGP